MGRCCVWRPFQTSRKPPELPGVLAFVKPGARAALTCIWIVYGASCAPEPDKKNISQPRHDYAEALGLATRFFGAQRCGDSDSWLHGVCHMEDGSGAGVPLTGGWHDAGDYAKFGQNSAGAAVILIHAFTTFPNSFKDTYSPKNSAPPANGVPDILDELYYLARYFWGAYSVGPPLRAWFQVGLAEYDHATFVGPQTQSQLTDITLGGQPRPVFSAGESCSNYFGAVSAFLSLYALALGERSADYNTAMQAARDYYRMGQTGPAACPAADNTYPAENYADEMAMAAIGLFRATGDPDYLDQARAWQAMPDFSLPTPSGLNSARLDPLVVYELYRLTAETYFLDQLALEAGNLAEQFAPCGYYHTQDWGSLPAAAAGAYATLLYTETTHIRATRRQAVSSVDFILGSHDNIDKDAPAGFSFVIGYDKLGGGYPRRPHHAASFGSHDLDWEEYSREERHPGDRKYAHELTGALVGGPRSPCANYSDNIGDYIGNEAAVDYNAYLVAALAAIIDHRKP